MGAGDSFTVVDRGQGAVTVRFRVGNGPQLSSDPQGRPLTITPTWDGQTLCVETKNADGDLVATSRRYLEGDRMVLQLTSPAGTVMRRIFRRVTGCERLAASGTRSCEVLPACTPSG